VQGGDKITINQGGKCMKLKMANMVLRAGPLLAYQVLKKIDSKKLQEKER
jgi:hypothetical protein